MILIYGVEIKLAENSHLGHRNRMKNRFLKTGFDSFERHEILEFLLFYAIPKKDTNELAHSLIKYFGSFAKVVDAPYEILLKIKGVGEHTVILLKQIPQLFRIYCEDLQQPCKVMDKIEKWVEFFKPKFIGRPNENLFVAGIDDSANFVACELVCEGSRNKIDIYYEKLVKFTIQWNIDRIVLAHNHPNGMAIPSISDKLGTEKLEVALKYLNITLMDHFIFGKNGDYISMRNYGVLKY